MRLDEVTRTEVVVTLSRRNLLTLLAKLDGHPPHSACTIVLPGGGDGPELLVRAEERRALRKPSGTTRSDAFRNRIANGGRESVTAIPTLGRVLLTGDVHGNTAWVVDHVLKQVRGQRR